MEVANYINAKNTLLKKFGIADDFYINPCIDKKWELDVDGELPLLKFGDQRDIQTCVIIKKDNTHMIYRGEKYTLVVALDCVKICFIFDNSNYKEKLNVRM